MGSKSLRPRRIAALLFAALACNLPAGLTQITPASPPGTPFRPPPTTTARPTPSPIPPTAPPPVEGDPYADRVVSFTPGNPANPALGDPQSVLGAPDFDATGLTGFLNLGVGGVVTVEFVDNSAVDGPGADIEIVGDPGDDEVWIVEVSADCASYASFGQLRERATLDLATVGLTSVRCVRLTDQGLAMGISPGTELDAVVALNTGAPAGSALNPYIVIAQLNLWYFGPGCYGGFEAFDCSGRRTTPLTPYLGSTYFSADPAVIDQQIEWAVEYGVDAFSLEWIAPRGMPGSLEENIDDAFLMAPNLYKIRWVIFYDFVLRLGWSPGPLVDISQGIDFDDPKVYDTFISDFAHFADKYFGQPQYLSIDGRPIVYVWSTWNFRGDFAAAVQEARTTAADRGFDVFIVGDEIRFDTFAKSHASVFDANTTFTFLIPGLPSWPADVGEAAALVDRIFQRWRTNIQGLKVSGRDDFVNFQPAWAPQYDDRLFNLANPIYVPALNRDQVVVMAQGARKHAEPVGSNEWRLVWLNTWNNWAETTTVEPTANLGPKYPAGNYQFDMLEVVREVFGPETFFP